MRVGVVGCSHTGNGYGISWAHYMGQKLNYEINDVSASGIGNEMMIEKIKRVLDNKNNIDRNKVDFFIMQVTEPSRLVLGLFGNDVKKEYKEKFNSLEYVENDSCHRIVNEISYYTYKYGVNDEEINYLLDKNYEISDFINKHVLISDFNMKIKVFHTLMSIQHLVNQYNKNILFFSWNVDLIKLSKEVGYYDIIKNMNIVDGCVENFAKNKKLKKIDNCHYGTNEHEIIYEDFLHEHIKKFIENNIK